MDCLYPSKDGPFKASRMGGHGSVGQPSENMDA